jgi:hypothetical protein
MTAWTLDSLHIAEMMSGGSVRRNGGHTAKIYLGDIYKMLSRLNGLLNHNGTGHDDGGKRPRSEKAK